MSQTLELIAATTWFWTFSTGFLASIILSVWSLFCPTVWWVIPVYTIWMLFDRRTSESGGRPVQWLRQLSWWRHMRNYFGFKLVADEGTELDPKKNYIFACYPHGIFPVGPFAAFVDGFQELFPEHRAFTTALNIQFWMPVIRELFLSVGSVSVSGPSIKHLLKKKDGGNIVSILIGGADESRYSQPGKYKIILKKRKGFVKMALQMGSPLVPVLSFGEPDVFGQLDFPGFGVIRDAIRNTTGIGMVIPLGSWLVCPNRVVVTTVVGKPIDVEVVASPTNEEIDKLHERFVEGIRKLFEDHKEKYVKDSKNTFLEIV